MKTLLIAEDEKLIRAGIRTMVQRSDVPVEEILEANNGEAAWELIQSRPIDAVFTDIRMPRMDGIELVKKIHEMEHPPITVAISGYDDFSYAVEMLRNGVTEYLLKPVERDKIQSVLKEIDEKLFRESKESRLLQYERILQEKPYRIANLRIGESATEGEGVVRLPEDVTAVFYIVEEGAVPHFLEEATSLGGIGLSCVHEGSEDVELAYKEAREARTQAFLLEKEVVLREDVENVEYPVDQKDYLKDTARTKRVQLVGTEKHKELVESYEVLFDAAKSGEISYQVFHQELRETLELLPKIYRNLFTQGTMYDELQELEIPLHFENLSSYKDALTEFLLELSNKSKVQDVTEPTQRKMATAVDYIRENYRSDLNMAVVSNYISMNYSLFSYAFKQYTGQNFVNYLKDLRLQEVRRLLIETDDKIIDIAHSVGYDNYKHFLKLFRMEYGVSPTEYRNNMNRSK